MTLLGALTGFAVLGVFVAALVIVLRGREGMDLSLGGLLRAYLYVGSLAGVIVFAAGLAGILAYVLAAGFGLDVIYGGPTPQPIPAIAPDCPLGQNCPPQLPPLLSDDRVRRQGEDLVRGATFVVFGGVFWAAHWFARRSLGGPDERAGGMYRAYLMLGTAIFGIATIALLPMGIYQALSLAIVQGGPYAFRPGAGESLSGGLAALPLWLAYLWLVLRVLRAPPSSTAV